MWSIGVANENARFVVLMGRSKRFEANRREFFVTFNCLVALSTLSNAYFLRFGHSSYDNDNNDNDNDDRTDYFKKKTLTRKPLVMAVAT